MRIDFNKYRKLIGCFFLLIGLAVFAGFFFHFSFTQDDAFISFRYAANYLDGYGLVYNIGERVEGYTNFLWTVWLILGKLWGINFIFLSRFLGFIFGAGTIILVYSLTRLVFEKIDWQGAVFAAGLTALITGTTLSFAYWSVSGLETSAFAFMFLLSVWGGIKRNPIVIPALVMATMLRPEGFLLAVILLVMDIITQRRLTRNAILAAALYIIFLVPLGAFKLFYYGGFLPNPFYAKTNFGLEQLYDGVEYTGRFFKHYLGAGLFLVPFLLFLKRLSKPMILIATVVFIYTLYIIIVGGDVLKVHRFFIPLIPLTSLLIVYGLVRLIRLRVLLMVTVLLIVGLRIYIPSDYVNTFHMREMGLISKMNKLMTHLLENDKSYFSLAASTIGLVGYRLQGHTVIDMLGLTDTTIARHPEPGCEDSDLRSTWRESKYNSLYLLGRQVDYILFSTGFKPSAPAEKALYQYSEFLRNYRAIGFPFSGKVHPIYKRYFYNSPDAQKDISPNFVNYFSEGIGVLWSHSDYDLALSLFDNAQKYCPLENYPFVKYYKHIAFKYKGDIEQAYKTLSGLAKMDTLAYQVYLNLCLFEYALGHRDTALFYRGQTLKILPWYKARLDSLIAVKN